MKEYWDKRSRVRQSVNAFESSWPILTDITPDHSCFIRPQSGSLHLLKV